MPHGHQCHMAPSLSHLASSNRFELPAEAAGVGHLAIAIAATKGAPVRAATATEAATSAAATTAAAAAAALATALGGTGTTNLGSPAEAVR